MFLSLLPQNKPSRQKRPREICAQRREPILHTPQLVPKMQTNLDRREAEWRHASRLWPVCRKDRRDAPRTPKRLREEKQPEKKIATYARRSPRSTSGNDVVLRRTNPLDWGTAQPMPCAALPSRSKYPIPSTATQPTVTVHLPLRLKRAYEVCISYDSSEILSRMLQGCKF